MCPMSLKTLLCVTTSSIPLPTLREVATKMATLFDEPLPRVHAAGVTFWLAPVEPTTSDDEPLAGSGAGGLPPN